MLGSVVGLLDLLLALLRPAVFAAGALTAVAALVSYSARTRRISPFSPLARFSRDRVDPWLIAPMERRILRAGGTPYAAPWWALAAVVVGGLVLLSAVGFLRDQLAMLAYMSGSTASLAALLVRCFRSLDALVGGDDAQRRAWMSSYNRALAGVPLDLVTTAQGLVATVVYLDRMRSPT